MLPVQKIRSGDWLETDDPVTVEEPLEIRIQYGPPGERTEQAISVTMRTPGHDAELAAGFLFTEGILSNTSSILSIDQGYAIDRTNTPGPGSPAHGSTSTGLSGPNRPANTILVRLSEEIPIDPGRLQRHFYTSSSCGACGKPSIDALRTVCPAPQPAGNWQITPELIYSLPGLLRQQQSIFEYTGGLHASALFDREGHLLFLREDIGRHNALDKLIGSGLQQNLLPFHSAILLLSGRACFELIQKAAIAGIRMIAAVGPPSSLAVQLAEEYGITLIGFLREQRFNVYTGSQRIRLTGSQK